MNDKKVRKLKGLFALLNKIERDKAIERQDIEKFNNPHYKLFEVEFSEGYLEVSHYCDLTCYDMERTHKWRGNGYVYVDRISYGCLFPSAVTIWNDLCNDLCYGENFGCVVSFVRAAIKNNGLDGLGFGTMKVTNDVTDYLDFKIKE